MKITGIIKHSIHSQTWASASWIVRIPWSCNINKHSKMRLEQMRSQSSFYFCQIAPLRGGGVSPAAMPKHAHGPNPSNDSEMLSFTLILHIHQDRLWILTHVCIFNISLVKTRTETSWAKPFLMLRKPLITDHVLISWMPLLEAIYHSAQGLGILRQAVFFFSELFVRLFAFHKSC